MRIAPFAAWFILSNAVFGQMHFRDDQKVDIRSEVGDSLSAWDPKVGELDDIDFNIRWSENGEAVVTTPNPKLGRAESTSFRTYSPEDDVFSASIRLVKLDQGQVLLVLDLKRLDSRGRTMQASPFAWKVALQSSPERLLDPTPENVTPLSVALNPSRQESRSIGLGTEVEFSVVEWSSTAYYKYYMHAWANEATRHIAHYYYPGRLSDLGRDI